MIIALLIAAWTFMALKFRKSARIKKMTVWLFKRKTN
jgi:hypothetical protein